MSAFARAAAGRAGGGLSVVVLLFLPAARPVDAPALVPERELALLRDIPIFAPLPPVTLEQLASNSHTSVSRRRRRLPGGTRRPLLPWSRRRGDGGAEGRPPLTLGRGGYFGRFALLRDVPRTATVTARSDVELWALERDIFIAAVTGHARAPRQRTR